MVKTKELELLEAKLRPFSKFEHIYALAQRLFQKSEGLRELLDSTLARVTPTQRHFATRQFILRVAKRAVEGHDLDVEDKFSRGVRELPKKVDAYLAFVDLTWVLLHSRSRDLGEGVAEGVAVVAEDEAILKLGGKRLVWHTFGLVDFQEPDVPHSRLRRRVKDFFPKDSHLSSVQTELDKDEENADEDSAKRVFFRMCSVRKTRKQATGNEQMLLKKVPTFFAYYPGEPYVYCDKSNPDDVYAEAIKECFGASEVTPIPLSGPNLDSLHRMRLTRDGHRPKFRIEETV